jgi:hypothetical protein
MGQIKLVGSLLMIGLFTLALGSWGIAFGEDNSAPVKIGDDPDFSSFRAQVESNVSQFKDDSETASESYFTSQVNPGDEVTESGQQFKVGIGTATSLASNSLSISFKKVFGQDGQFGLFLTIILGFILFLGIMYGYKAWFGRNPD